MNQLFVLRDESHAQRLWAFLRSNWEQMAKAGKFLAVQVFEYQSKRTLEQNAKLHAMIGDIAKSAWIGGRQYSDEVWKEQIRRQFIGTEEVDLPDGTRIERGISTTTLNVEQFSALIERVYQYAAEDLGVYLA